MFSKPMALAATLLLTSWTPPALAQDISTAATPACVERARSDGADPKLCLAQVHAPCQSISAETPALVTLCFDTAREAWTRATAARLDEITHDAPEQIGARTRIDTKYDLLAGLLQCDRLEELGHLTEIEDDRLLLEKTRCEATATGLAYIRLLWRVTKD